MNSIGFKANGAVVYWSLAEWNHYQRLNASLEHLGLEARVEARTNYSALKDTLGDLFPDCKIEPLDDRGHDPENPLDSFEVVRCERGTDRNAWHHLYKVTISRKHQLQMVPWDHATAQRVAEKFNHHAGLVRSHKITEVLVKTIEQTMGGQALRPRGGLYWIPTPQLGLWRQLSDRIEQAAASGTSKLYTLQVLFDPESVRAVRDALAASIRQEVALIKDDVMSGTLKARGLEARRGQAVALREQVKLYEDLLETGLSDLAQLAEEAEMAAADAALTLASGVEA